MGKRLEMKAKTRKVGMALLCAASAMALAGCQWQYGPPPEATLVMPAKSVAPQASSGTRPSPTKLGPETPAAPAASEAAPTLGGRIIALAVSSAGAGNDVWAIEPGTGGRQLLWSLAEITTVGDWLVRPEGDRVLYRLSAANASAWDRLFVQALTPEAEPTTIAASSKMWQAHLAGARWAPDGNRVAYGWQVGLPPHSTRSLVIEPSWELRIAAVDKPTARSAPAVVWRSPFDPRRVPLSLVAWDVASRRVMLVESTPRGGHAQSVWLVGLNRGQLLRMWKVDVVPSEVVASADGRWVAVPDQDPPGLVLIHLATGTTRGIAPLEAGWQPVGVVWSSSGEWLSWTEVPLGDERPTRGGSNRPLVGEREEGQPVSRIRALPFHPDSGPSASKPELQVAVPGAHSRSLCFSPDGRYLLVAQRANEAIDAARLLLYDLTDGSAQTLGWSLPEATWRVDWVP